MFANFKCFKVNFLLLSTILFCSITFASEVKSIKTTETSVATTGDRKPATDNKLSFYFRNVEIKTLLELISKTSGMNFIISDRIQGTTTLNIKDVTWKQALDIVLQSHGLAYRQVGKALIINNMDEILKEESRQLQAAQELENLTPLTTAVITLKYADVAVLEKILKGEGASILSGRGEAAADVRTNSMMIRDTKSNLKNVISYLRRIDIPAKQVSIEARIVNIDSRFEAELGVRFGISSGRHLSGTFAEASNIANGASISDFSSLPADSRLNFNVPASKLSSGRTPASIGLALARLGPVLLDLELSALEEEGRSQIISKPRVVTSNQQKAIIQTGEEIPYQQATSSGATSIEFKKAVLSLEIIPQITPDNKIILKLKATQDTRGDQLLVQEATTNGSTTTPAVFGPPTINTQAVESYVLLNDNETVVIGGVYKLSKTNTIDRVPFISDLPLIGSLFKHRGIKNQKTELLIFLTPKIIHSTSGHTQVVFKGE